MQKWGQQVKPTHDTEMICDTEHVLIEASDTTAFFAWSADANELELSDARSILIELGFVYQTGEYYDEDWSRTCITLAKVEGPDAA